MATYIRTIGTVKLKDGSTECVICCYDNPQGVIFETLEGNRYLYPEYANKYANNGAELYNRFNHPFLMNHNDFYKYDYDSTEWEEVTHIIESISVTR